MPSEGNSGSRKEPPYFTPPHHSSNAYPESFSAYLVSFTFKLVVLIYSGCRIRAETKEAAGATY